MILTDNQRQFLQRHLFLWTGLPLEAEIPPEYCSLILGLTDGDRKEVTPLADQPPSQIECFPEPLINQWVMEQAKKYRLDSPVGRKPCPLWPEGKRFAACLTHDVDHVNLDDWRPRARQFKYNLAQLFARPSRIAPVFESFCKLAISMALEVANRSPMANYFDTLTAIEEHYGARSTFFFFPDRISRPQPQDGRRYRYRDRVLFEGQRLTVAELMRHLDRRGWEIGLHASFAAFDDPGELQRQKVQVEDFLGKEIVSVRQHLLHFEPRNTPRAQSQAGFHYDSSFGSDDSIGFPNGLAFPFYHYNLVADRALPLLQLPLHIQDGALWISFDGSFNPTQAWLQAKEVVDKAAAVQGLVTLLWHSDSSEVRRYPGLFWVYEQLLDYLIQRDAWVTTVREIGRWWEEREKILSAWNHIS